MDVGNVFQRYGFEVVDTAWADNLSRGLDYYMVDIMDSDDTLSGVYYCGCEVCFSREILFYVVPNLLEGLLEGKIKGTKNSVDISVHLG